MSARGAWGVPGFGGGAQDGVAAFVEANSHMKASPVK
jgi:hypothetical protein